MEVDQEKAIVLDDEVPVEPAPPLPEQPRSFLAEWTVTFILLLFGTTSLVQAFVIPTGYARADDTLYIHGSQASRMLRTLSQGLPVCVTVTLTDWA